MPLLTKPNTRFVYLKKKVPAMTYSAAGRRPGRPRPLRHLPRERPDPHLSRTARSAGVGGRLRRRRRQGPGRAGAQAEHPAGRASRARRTYESAPNGSKIPLGTSTHHPGPERPELPADHRLRAAVDGRAAAGRSRSRTTKSDFGFAIAMNVKTGEVLALAQAPTFDSSDPGAAEAGGPRQPGDHRPVRAGQRAEGPHLRGADRLRHRRRRTPGW